MNVGGVGQINGGGCDFTISILHFNGNIRPMKSTTSVYIAIIGLEYLIIACYVCIITYKGL